MNHAKISSTYVPSEGSPTAKIWIVGEAPGEDEERELRPFIGRSGDYLFSSLLKYGITREDCFITNVCHYRPYGNKFENLEDSDELARGVQELQDQLATFQPICILALGGTALSALTDSKGIWKWRGSILQTRFGHKVIPCFHPAYILRDAGHSPTFDFDIRRFAEECKFPELNYPVRNYHILDQNSVLLEDWVVRLCNEDRLAVDIETVIGSTHMLCIGFAPNPSEAVCIPYNKSSGLIRDAIERILSSQSKKIFHFGSFDAQVLRENGYTVNNYWWDTMASQQVMWCELPRSLAYLTSVYTRQPYYKHIGGESIPDDVKGWNSKTNKKALYDYNCTDVCVTAEIQLLQEEEINEDKGWQRYLKYKMEQIQLALDISKNGLLIDITRQTLFKNSLDSQLQSCSMGLNLIAKDLVNANSPKQMQEFLYGKLGLPVRKKRNGKITTDEDAIVSLVSFVRNKLDELVRASSKEEWEFKLLALKGLLKIRGLQKLLGTYIDIVIHDDGRARSTFKVCSTETSRWACEQYVDGTGINAQTLPRGEIECQLQESSSPQ